MELLLKLIIVKIMKKENPLKDEQSNDTRTLSEVSVEKLRKMTVKERG